MTEEEVLVQDGGMREKPLNQGDLKEIERMEAEKNKDLAKESATEIETPELADNYAIEPPKSKEQVISEIKNEQADGMLKFARETLIAKEEGRTAEKKPKKKRKTRQKKLEIEAPKELAKELAEPAVEIAKKMVNEIVKQDLIENDPTIKTLADDLLTAVAEKFNVPLIEREIQIKEVDGSQLAVRSKEVEKDYKPQTKDQEQLLGPQKSYKLLQKIGQGGFGTVYEIEETTTGVRKAVKIFHQEKAGKISVKKLEDKVKEINKRCDEEVVKIDHVCKDEKGLYVIMQLMKETADKYAEGKTVKERIDLFYKLLANVKKLHEHGLIHKDLKPSNVLIDKYGNPKLSDTDLVQIIEREGGVEISDVLATTTGTVVRSLYYTAPEQLNDEKVDSRADVYSLGVLLYEFVTGEQFSTDWMAEMESKNYTSDLIKIISKAIRKNVDSRYQNVEELRKDLEKVDLEKLIVEKKDSGEKKITDGELVEFVKDGKSVGKYKIVGFADVDKVIVKQPEVDEKREKNISKCFANRIKSHWSKIDYWNLITQMASIADGVNDILKKHGDCLTQKNFKACVKHKQFRHEKKLTDFRSLEEAITKGYKLEAYEKGTYYDIDTDFESEKIKLWISDVPASPLSGIWISATMKTPFEGNQKLYSEIQDYIEKQLKSWWRNTKHFKELEQQGYTYETARQLFLNGTFEQFVKKDGAGKGCYGNAGSSTNENFENNSTEVRTVYNIKIDDLEKKIIPFKFPQKLTNAIEVKDDDKTFIYVGEFYDFENNQEIDKIRGRAMIRKMEKKVNCEEKLIWEVDTATTKFMVYNHKLANNIKETTDYKGMLAYHAEKKALKLTSKLLNLVFDPLDKIIMAIQKERKANMS